MTKKRGFWILALVLTGLFLSGSGSLRAQDRIWSALVLATNEKPAKLIPDSLKPFAEELKEVFGYNSFYLLGEKRQRVKEGDSEWILPSKEVFLHLTALNKEVATYEVSLDLYDRKKLTLTSRVKLARGAPLYIRGPQWGNGQLIYILEIQ
ncbi:MAG: hypothetical protein ACOVMP_06705 [Chthoniobacterales bacterium]